MFNLKKTLALLAVPAALTLGGALVVAQAAGPNAGPGAPQHLAAVAGQTEAAEQPDSAPEMAESSEPAEPGGGHVDADNQVDHQATGAE
jgi:hypothetical protein